MKIYWVHDDHLHPAQLLPAGSSNVIRVHGPDVFPPEMGGVDAAVVHANSGRGRRAGRLGLKWLQGIRRELRSTIPVLVYSFEAREVLEREYSILKDDVPGAGYLRLPLPPEQFESRLASIAPLGEAQLQEVIRWHTGLQELWGVWFHDLGHALRDWPEHKAAAERILGLLSESVAKFAPEQQPALRRLTASFDKSTEHARLEIQSLEAGLCSKLPAAGAPPAESLPPAPYDRPPRGYSTIAIADDHGYEQATVSQLKRYGYDVSPVALNLEEASNLLLYWCPSVVLADLHLNSTEDGLELMRRALARGCLVILISRAKVAAHVIPDGVLDSSGGHDFQDADRLHRLIWRRALAEGIRDHV